MQLYMVKTIEVETGEMNWFFVAAENVDHVRAMCEDDITKIVELIDHPADMADVVRHEYDLVALLAQV